jgi:hypothetical protein
MDWRCRFLTGSAPEEDTRETGLRLQNTFAKKDHGLTSHARKAGEKGAMLVADCSDRSERGA